MNKAMRTVELEDDVVLDACPAHPQGAPPKISQGDVGDGVKGPDRLVDLLGTK